MKNSLILILTMIISVNLFSQSNVTRKEFNDFRKSTEKEIKLLRDKIDSNFIWKIKSLEEENDYLRSIVNCGEPIKSASLNDNKLLAEVVSVMGLKYSQKVIVTFWLTNLDVNGNFYICGSDVKAIDYMGNSYKGTDYISSTLFTNVKTKFVVEFPGILSDVKVLRALHLSGSFNMKSLETTFSDLPVLWK